MAVDLEQLLKDYEARVEEMQTTEAERYGKALAIYDEIISRYRPGGEFEKKYLGQLQKQKKREVASSTQSLASRGLYGTTLAAGLGRQWEEEVGAPARLELEDVLMQRLSSAQIGKAGLMTQGVSAPGYGTVASLMSQLSGGGYGGGTGGKTGGGVGFKKGDIGFKQGGNVGYYSGGGGTSWSQFTAANAAKRESTNGTSGSNVYGGGFVGSQYNPDLAPGKVSSQYSFPGGGAAGAYDPNAGRNWAEYGKKWFIAGMSKEEAMKKLGYS